jgi:hypothetical protein
VSLHVHTSFWVFLKYVDLHVPTYFVNFICKKDAKTKTCECNFLFIFMPPRYGVHMALKKCKSRKYFYDFFNAGIGE